MILLHKIQIKDFLSHHNTSIVFEQNQSVLIDGISGSGKSSIIDAIVWALYNESRSDNRSLIKKGAKSAQVTLELIDDEKGITYIAERSITNKGKHDFTLSEKTKNSKIIPVKTTGIKGTQEYLEQIILRSSYALFINSIVHTQNSTETFVHQNASRRKELLLEIIKASDYDDYLKRTKEAIQERKTKTEVVESKIETANQTIASQSEKTSKIDEYRKENEQLTKDLESIEQKKKELIAQEKEVSAFLVQLKSKQSEIADILLRISRNDEKIKLLNKKIIDVETVDVADIQKKVDELTNAKKLLDSYDQVLKQEQLWKDSMTRLIIQTPADHDYDSEIKELNKQLIEVMQEEVEKCQKCGTPYPKMEERRSQRAESLRVGLEERQKGKDALQEAKDAHNAQKQALGACPSVNHDEIDSLKAKIRELEPYERKLVELQGKKAIVEESVKEIQSISLEQKELSDKKESIEKELTGIDAFEEKEKEINNKISEQNIASQIASSNLMTNKANLMMAEESIKIVEKCKKDIEEFSKEIGTNKEELEALSVLKESFGPNGIQAIVVDYVIPELEERINAILEKLSDFKVRLDTQKGGIGENTVLEGLFITIINPNGEEMDYASFSGGEKLKISVSISEALAEIQRVGFRVLDELFVGLDEESIEGFKTVMLELQDRFSQMICVSHLQQIKDLFEDKIYVLKVNGTSKINK